MYSIIYIVITGTKRSADGDAESVEMRPFTTLDLARNYLHLCINNSCKPENWHLVDNDYYGSLTSFVYIKKHYLDNMDDLLELY